MKKLSSLFPAGTECIQRKPKARLSTSKTSHPSVFMESTMTSSFAYPVPLARPSLQDDDPIKKDLLPPTPLLSVYGIALRGERPVRLFLSKRKAASALFLWLALLPRDEARNVLWPVEARVSEREIDALSETDRRRERLASFNRDPLAFARQFEEDTLACFLAPFDLDPFDLLDPPSEIASKRALESALFSFP